MVTFFKLRCFKPSTSARILVIVNVILACLAIIHWGYCGVLKTFVDLYKDSTNGVQGSYTQMKTLLNSVIAFCVITGIVQLLTSILIILINLSCLGNTKRNIWTRVISTTVILSLASNFAVAAITGMLYTYFKQVFGAYFVDFNYYQGTYFKDWLIAMRNSVQFTLAETLLTFLLTLPLIGITLHAFLENSWENNMEESLHPAKQLQAHSGSLQSND